MNTRIVDYKNKNCHLIVPTNYWEKYKQFAFVERVCFSIDEARLVKQSLECCDRISFSIIKVKGGSYEEVY